MTTPLSLAEKLKDLRIEHNFTQKYISTYLQMSRGGYSQYELGKRCPSYETLLRLSKLYNININEFINFDKVPIPNTDRASHKEPTAPSYTHSINLQSIKRFVMKLLSYHPNFNFDELTKKDLDFIAEYKLLDQESQQDIRLFVSCKLKRHRIDKKVKE